MRDQDWLAGQFEAHRGHLRAVAFRMLGSMSEADDAVQEAWLRLSRSDTSDVANLGGWLTTVVGRIALDVLRSRGIRREESWDERPLEPVDDDDGPDDPESHALLADAMGSALLVVLDTLTPSERLAFVLHDLFGVSFEDIGPIVGRNAVTARQLASRARRRVQGAASSGAMDLARQRRVVDAFLAASRGGDFSALLSLLDPDVVLRADATAVLSARAAPTAPQFEAELHGADAVARTFVGRAQAAQPALVDGVAGATWAPGGVPRVTFAFRIVDGRIVEIDVVADPAKLAESDVLLDA